MNENQSNQNPNPNAGMTPNPGQPYPQGAQPQANPGQGYYPGGQQPYPQPQSGAGRPGYPQGVPNYRAPQSGQAPQGGQNPLHPRPQPGAVPQQPYPQGARQQKAPKAKKPRGDAFGRWVFLGIIIFVLLIVGGAVLGYNTAISARQAEENRQKIQAASQQYQLALQDIANEKYENASKRLEWVIGVDPNYPGASEKFMEVQVALFPKATPTPMMTFTPEPTATPDLRGEADMLNSARSLMAAKDWKGAIDSLNALRDKNLEFESLTVDGMYYISLRYLGIQEIGDGYLEPGIYKITLAEAFGPIDFEANNSRLAARSYLAGAGFWEINWEKALNYYSNAYQSNPYMYDRSSGKTAQQRYVEASYRYADQLIETNESGSELYCSAREYYVNSLSISLNDAVAATATAVQLACEPPTAIPEVPSAPPAMIETPTLLGEAPAEVPTEEPIIPPAPPEAPPAEAAPVTP